MGILKVIGLNANAQDDYGHSLGHLMHIQSATSCTLSDWKTAKNMGLAIRWHWEA